MLWHVFVVFIFFFFNDTATTEIYTLSLHDALPISRGRPDGARPVADGSPDAPSVASRYQLADSDLVVAGLGPATDSTQAVRALGSPRSTRAYRLYNDGELPVVDWEFHDLTLTFRSGSLFMARI